MLKRSALSDISIKNSKYVRGVERDEVTEKKGTQKFDLLSKDFMRVKDKNERIKQTKKQDESQMIEEESIFGHEETTFIQE